jgi:hypothetical protein
MAEENKQSGGIWTAIALAAKEWAQTPFPYLLGGALLITGGKWDGHLHDQKGCFQLQEVKGAIYKVDTCSGKTEEVKPAPTVSKPIEPASSASGG